MGTALRAAAAGDHHDPAVNHQAIDIISGCLLLRAGPAPATLQLCSSTHDQLQRGPDLLAPDDHLQERSNYRSAAAACRKKYTRCMKFFSTSGCPYGEQCHFQHFASPGMSQLVTTIMASLPASLKGAKKRALMANLLDPSLHIKGYKTKLCYNYSNSAQGCRYGEHCHFAHTEAELRSETSFGPTKVHNWHSNRELQPDRFSINPWGSLTSNTGKILISCHTPLPSSNLTACLHTPHCKHMKHSAPMDNLSSSLYYGEPSPPGISISSCTEASAEDCIKSYEGWGATTSPSSVLTIDPCKTREECCNPVVATSMSIDADMVGFIIGRAGCNVRHISKLTGSRLSIREHSPKVRIVHMEGLPYQVDGAQQMINLLLEAREGSQRKSLS